jgi:hypothetical protein
MPSRIGAVQSVRWPDEHALDCPKCGPCDAPYLHMKRFSLYDEESLSITYGCELCGERSVLKLEQHKGQTLLYWQM